MTDTTTIRLCENEDVQAYNKAYANEMDRVEEICGNAVQETQDSRQFVALDMDDECTLHKTNSNLLKDRESSCHCFHIEDDDETMLRSLSVTVVYSGSFNSATYSPGELSVELKQVSEDCTSSIEIGHSPPELQRLNKRIN